MLATAAPGRAPADAVAPRVDRREARAMGSPLRLHVAGRPPAGLVDAAWGQVVDEFEATEQALSRFRPTSEIHRLRLAGGRSDAPSRRLVAALAAADRARRLTEGRFDPRVLLDLERLGSVPISAPEATPPRRPDAVPDPRPAATPGPRPAAMPSPRPDPAASIFVRAGRAGSVEIPVPVDFGGIGKGLALRWGARRAATSLRERPFLLDAGGDIVASGAPGVDGWRIGIEDPRRLAAPPGTQPGATADAAAGDAGDEPLVVVELPRTGGAIATSSVRRARWLDRDGRAVHHLIDPRTGEPGGDGLFAVTVTAPDPAWAEVWAKSLFLEGRNGIAAVARRRGLAAWWVAADGTIEMTPAARLRTVWVAGES